VIERPLPPAQDLDLVILDCDGVLFDSWEANVAFYDSILAAMERGPLDDHGRELCHRLSGPQLWTALFGDDPPACQRAKEVAARADYSPFFGLMRPATDLHETLETLTAHCRLALATNRGRTVAGVLSRFDLGRFFSVSLGILDVSRPKPAPDLLLACLERTGVPAAAAVYVGDTSVDCAAATAAEVAYVGIGPGSGAAITIRELRELPRTLGIPTR
jgi:phosphoglycolate phosphatase-like HAD superfamily hydrolase